MPWYVPSLKVRKVQSGHPCPGCSLLMHHGDMVAWSGPHGTVYIHDKCAELLLQNPDVIPEKSDGAAGGENETV